MEQQGANYVVDCAEHAFSFAVLWRGVGAQKMQGNVMAR
jgi:hypothetical protein